MNIEIPYSSEEELASDELRENVRSYFEKFSEIFNFGKGVSAKSKPESNTDTELEPEAIDIKINEWGIVRDKKVEDYYWGCLSDYVDDTIRELAADSYDDFEEFQDKLEDHMGYFIILLIDKSDLNTQSFDSNREYLENIEDVLSKEKIERILKTINTPKEFSSLDDVPEDEIAVLLFTDDWDFITYYGLHKDDTPDEEQFYQM